jgi:hypothetical protein
MTLAILLLAASCSQVVGWRLAGAQPASRGGDYARRSGAGRTVARFGVRGLSRWFRGARSTSGAAGLTSPSAEAAGGVKRSPSGPAAGRRAAVRLTPADVRSYLGAAPACGSGRPAPVSDVVSLLVATDGAIEKLGARDISAEEAAQLARNRHAVLSSARVAGRRRFLIGAADGGRVLTLVVEQTVDPTTWLVVTGWTAAERRILGW